MKSGIYAIRSHVSGKLYVGSAGSIPARWALHRKRLRGGYHTNPHLQAAWEAYGEDAFEFLVLEHCEIKDLLVREQYYIDFFLAADNEKGYNIARIAGAPMRGCKKTRESVARGVAERAGYTHSEETRAKISAGNKGKIISAEQRELMTTSSRKYWSTPEARAQQSTKFKGRTQSEEAKAKIGEGTKKALADPEIRARQLAGLKDVYTRPEWVEKQRKQTTSRWADPVYRAKMSAAAKAQWADPAMRAKMSARHKVNEEQLSVELTTTI